MTLILTEISHAGIAMVADSAISQRVRGNLRITDHKGWKKLLRVPRIRAGISYWGPIGLITRERFDHWLQRRIDRGSYTDLRDFADYLAAEMNDAAGGKPLPEGEQLGIHVAGHQHWSDGSLRPTFFHVHNGDSHVVLQESRGTGEYQNTIVKRVPIWKMKPRELFTRHDDFTPENMAPDALEAGNSSIWRNGDFAPFHVLFRNLVPLIQQLNTMDFGIPNKPAELGARVGFLKAQLEITISLYRCSSMPKSIGGKVRTLGIKPDGSYLMSDDLDAT